MEQAHRILVTGFEPFGGALLNTSAEVLRRLPDTIGGWQVTKAVLPVVFGRAAEEALRYAADLTVLLGEAGGRTLVTPELHAKYPQSTADRPQGRPQRPRIPQSPQARE